MASKEKYDRIFANLTVKGGIGLCVGAIPSMILFRSAILRSSVSALGLGIGLGIAAEQADRYLKTGEDQMMNNKNIQESLNTIKTNFYSNFKQVYDLLPASWRPW
eukprot:Platyproteum_vivax@DN8364_c0_g1_i1.p1